MATSILDAPPTDHPRTPAYLSTLTTRADALYAKKQYGDAAVLYSEATELQAELNGEMEPSNADLLYAYGRCLYHVAVDRSDVLGSKVAGPTLPKNSKSEKSKDVTSEDIPAVGETLEVRTEGGQSLAEAAAKQVHTAQADQPFFQIEGDGADWSDDSDDDDDDDNNNEGIGEGADEEEDDDFITAYEILEMARVLLQRQIEALEEEPQNGETAETQKLPHASVTLSSQSFQKHFTLLQKKQDRLADIHDLQAEINLENERFLDAVPDCRSSLALKETIYPPESSLVSEAHYKLSLALEFASVQKQPEESEELAPGNGEGSSAAPTASSLAAAMLGGPENQQQIKIDQQLRDEAAEHAEMAISSSKLRVTKEKEKLAELSAMIARRAAGASEDSTGDSALGELTEADRSLSLEDLIERKRRDIAEVEEIISDMQTRLEELKNPPQILAGGGHPGQGSEYVANEMAKNELFSGLLGSLAGEKPDVQKQKIQEAMSAAKDVTSMVKRKDKKRKVELEGEDAGAESEGSKKARLD